MTHIDEARRIVKAWGANMNASWDRPIADIAAALAAAERAGIERAADAANERLTHCHPVLEDRLGSCRACEQAHIERRIRALLPAEPAAKCATCGQYPSRGWVPAERADGWVPCPSCAGGGA